VFCSDPSSPCRTAVTPPRPESTRRIGSSLGWIGRITPRESPGNGRFPKGSTGTLGGRNGQQRPVAVRCAYASRPRAHLLPSPVPSRPTLVG
jgi:hypothetical protein